MVKSIFFITFFVFNYSGFITQSLFAQNIIQVSQKSDHFVAISVLDFEQSKLWYEKFFGLKEIYNYQTESGDLKIGIYANSGFKIEIQYHATASESKVPKDKQYLETGVFKYGLGIKNFSKAIDLFKRNNVNFVVEPFDDQVSGSRSAIINDNSGNLIQLFEINTEG